MSERWLRAAQVLFIGAAVIAGCNREGGPAPEVPSLYAGNGGINGGGSGGSSGVGGASGGAGEGGHAGVDSGSGGMMAGGSGGAGGLAGVGGTGGFGGTGGGGGMAGAGVSDPCSDSDAVSTELPIDPSAVELSQLLMKGITVGSNGTFEDSCTDGGDLLEHVCETQLRCNGQSGQADGACAPSPHLTGVVLEVNSYCFGQCMDGVCYVPCPEADEVLTVTQVAGASVELRASAGIRFTCTRDFCLAPAPSNGDELTVASSPVPNDTQVDCRQSFGSALEPLTLSDGCNYFECAPLHLSDP